MEGLNESAFDSFEAKYKESNCNWLFDAKFPECSGVFSDENEIGDSPQVSIAPAFKTPLRHDGRVSSPQLHTPQPKDLRLPFATCNESPINQCVYAASTPFHGQRIISASSVGSDVNRNICNETYDKAPSTDVSLQQLTSDNKRNETFQVKNNVTFNMSTAQKNQTFDCDGIRNPHVASLGISTVTSNATFNKAENSTLDRAHLGATFNTEAAEKDSGSDIMESCTHLESSADSECKQEQRKPLKTLPQPKAGSAIQKKPSRLAAPRMNAAALSRIQARSPQSKPSNGKANAIPENKLLKKPSTATVLKTRKSMLPPSSTTKLSMLTKTRPQKPVVSETQDQKTKAEPSGSPMKRKAQESPKRIARSAKVAGKQVPAYSSSLPSRATSAPNSRLPAATTRITRLPRSSGIKGPSTFSKTVKKPTAISSLTSLKQESKPVPTTGTNGVSDQDDIPAEGNIRPARSKKAEKKVESHVALAILLDYVVNKVEGLSVPRLKEELRIQKSIFEQQEIANGLLSQKIDQLESALQAEQQQCVQLQTELSNEQYAHQESQERISQLLGELENERQKHREKLIEMEVEKEAIKSESAHKIMVIKDECDYECQKLRDEVETTVQSELKERMKPYVNAKSEVDSMSAIVEMKNETIHKLEAECAALSAERDNLGVLRHKIDQLTQKNEELEMKLQEKIEETRQLSLECGKLHRSFTEERSATAKLRQHNEELQYRLESASPSSPRFNPVFTTSPAIGVFSDKFSTPRDQKFFRRDESSKPRSLSYESNGDCSKDCDNTA